MFVDVVNLMLFIHNYLRKIKYSAISLTFEFDIPHYYDKCISNGSAVVVIVS